MSSSSDDIAFLITRLLRPDIPDLMGDGLAITEGAYSVRGKESMYASRFYRHWIKDSGLVPFNVVVAQTDLYIRSRRNLKHKALNSVLKHRRSLEAYIERHPLFLTTLEPYQAEAEAPAMVQEMARVSQFTGVGPLAAVAGAIAEAVGRDLLAFSPEVIVETRRRHFSENS